jgi:23S rRNA (adenine2503-C2)-methyltransferase
VPNQDFASPDSEAINRFAYILKKAHIPYTIRVSMGDDIDAACGQLAAKRN